MVDKNLQVYVKGGPTLQWRSDVSPVSGGPTEVMSHWYRVGPWLMRIGKWILEYGSGLDIVGDDTFSLASIY
jgi:hypothetical protein